MKKDADYFSDSTGGLPAEHKADLIFVAKRLKDATRLEDLLDAAGIDFGVEADEYQGGIIFKTARVGAFFLCAQGSAGSRGGGTAGQRLHPGGSGADAA